MSEVPVKILHLSDLHFGRINQLVLEDLNNFIEKNKSTLNLIILTGDLTQRAKKNEFLEAKKFIEKLGCPFLIVPGNHDIPLYNIFLRFFFPYKRFCKYLGQYAQNFFEDSNLAVYGLWSSNRFTVKHVKIYDRDLKNIEDKFKNITPNKIKIIASHHSLFSNDRPIKGDCLRILSLKPHLLLSGHEHQSLVRHIGEKELPLIISCGTTTSTRTRIESNSFNLITINPTREIWIETYVRDEQGFGTSVKFQATI